jgi:hypothetical protein
MKDSDIFHILHAHSTLPSPSPQATTLALDLGIAFFITRAPAARGKF